MQRRCNCRGFCGGWGMSEVIDWERTTLGKHCVICTGKKDVNEGEKFGSYPFFTCSRNHIYSNKFSFDTEALLIAGNGEVGNVEYYNGKFEAYQRTYVLDRFDINIQYVYHVLKYFLKDTLSRSHAGSVIQFIKLEDLAQFAFFYPNVNQEAVKIVDILDTLDTTIQQTEAIIQKLKQVKQGLLHDLLTRGIDANGELRPSYDDAPHLYKESPLGWIPKEWEVIGLADVEPRTRSVIKTGPFGSALKGEHWREIGHPVITIGSLGMGIFIDDELLFVDDITARRLSDFEVIAGDIVFSRVADVGKSVVVGVAQQGWLMSSNLMRISVDKVKVLPELLQLMLAYASSIRRQIRANVNSGGRDVANSAVLMGLKFPIPIFSEQKKIVNKAYDLSLRIEKEECELNKLLLTKTALMDDLLTGRVRVTSLLQAEANNA